VVKLEIVYAKQAMKDAKKLAASGLKQKAQELIAVLAISKSTAIRKIGRRSCRCIFASHQYSAPYRVRSL
jgi:hypothetical protein